MASQKDAKVIDESGKPKAKRRFDARDFDHIAETIYDDYDTRKRKRGDLERQWDEIDRQIAMIPDTQHKKLPNGKTDARKMWMSEMELPLQAQALEVLTADARRMMFPVNGPWFRAHSETTDAYLREVDFESIILGDEMEVPSIINQDNADKLAEGFLRHIFRQNDMVGRFDRINAESFRYGMGVGRARRETKSVYIHEARGVRKENQKLPVIVPVSIRNLYLDTPMPSMHSAQVLGETHIAEDFIKLVNLQLAANAGSTNPDNEDGGWMPKNVAKLESDDDGYVKVLELEGDFVVPRKTTRSMVLPGAIITVAVGKGERQVIRFRWRKDPFSSYLLFPYHHESASEAYPTSPLMKGRTVQAGAVQALNRLLDGAALKNSPPVGWDKSDMGMAQNGGPVIHPFAVWETIDPSAIKVFDEVGGDPTAMASAMSLFINLYGELTGILPGRLGAQTVSHTTAFAKDAELTRGAVRTVDYVEQSGSGPILKWLDMAYKMGREDMGRNKTVSFYIDSYGGFVNVAKRHLPENVYFEWFGSGGPAEAAQKRQAKLQSITTAIQLDQMLLQTGQPGTMDVPAAQREILREGGWTDVDGITKAPEAAPQPQTGIPGEGIPGAGLPPEGQVV